MLGGLHLVENRSDSRGTGADVSWVIIEALEGVCGDIGHCELVRHLLEQGFEVDVEALLKERRESREHSDNLVLSTFSCECKASFSSIFGGLHVGPDCGLRSDINDDVDGRGFGGCPRSLVKLDGALGVSDLRRFKSQKTSQEKRRENTPSTQYPSARAWEFLLRGKWRKMASRDP